MIRPPSHRPPETDRADPTDAPAPVLNCLVVDDDPTTLDQLARMLRDNPCVATVTTAASSADALRVLRNVEVDVAFIEVRMPGMDGLDLASVLSRFAVPPAVVFVARSPEYAAEAFDLGAVDYLRKPPRPDRLAESLRRVAAARHAARLELPRTTTERTGHGVPASTAPAQSAPVNTADERIPVTLGASTRLVRRSTVRWVEAQGDYVRLHTADGAYLVRANLSTLANQWRGAGLVRIHRSYLVQLRCVRDVVSESGRLTVVVDGSRLPVSRRMASTLQGQLVKACAAVR